MAYRGAEFTVVAWAADEYVVCFKGQPVGQTLHKTEAEQIARWLGTAINELVKIGAETPKKGEGDKR